MGAFEEKKPMTKPKTATDVFEIAANQLDAVTMLMQRIDKSATEQFIQTILHAKRIFVTGRGRSSLLTGWFAMRLMQMGFDVHVPGEVTCPRIEKSDLLVTVSCSGSTTTTVELANIAAKSGATVVAITAVLIGMVAVIIVSNRRSQVVIEELREKNKNNKKKVKKQRK